MEKIYVCNLDTSVRLCYFNNTHFLTVSNNEEIILWNNNDFSQRRRFYEYTISCILPLRDDNLVIYCSKTRSLYVVNTNNDMLVHTIKCISDMNFLHEYNNNIMLVYTHSYEIVNINENKDLSVLTHGSSIKNIVYLNNYIITSDNDNSINIWCPKTDKCLSILKGHSNEITKLIEYSPEILVSSSIDRCLKFWHLNSHNLVFTKITDYAIYDILAYKKSIIYCNEKNISKLNRDSNDIVFNDFGADNIKKMKKSLIGWWHEWDLIIWDIVTKNKLLFRPNNYIDKLVSFRKDLILYSSASKFILFDIAKLEEKEIINTKFEIKFIEKLNKKEIAFSINDYSLAVLDVRTKRQRKLSRVKGESYLKFELK
jgi:hypothetical protein